MSVAALTNLQAVLPHLFQDEFADDDDCEHCPFVEDLFSVGGDAAVGFLKKGWSSGTVFLPKSLSAAAQATSGGLDSGSSLKLVEVKNAAADAPDPSVKRGERVSKKRFRDMEETEAGPALRI